MKARKAIGFTLIEVLIALMLLSIVMYVGNLSFSIFSERWRKELGDFNLNAESARKFLLLRQAVKGASNYLTRDGNGNAVYLFEGDSQQLAFVTNKPIFNPTYQALVHLTVKTLSSGRQQLVYAEYSFRHGAPVQHDFKPDMSDRLVLFEAEDIRFNYYGWKSFADRSLYIEQSEGGLEWQDNYSASEIGMIPFALNLTWSKNEPLVFLLNHDNRFKMIYVDDPV